MPKNVKSQSVHNTLDGDCPREYRDDYIGRDRPPAAMPIVFALSLLGVVAAGYMFLVL